MSKRICSIILIMMIGLTNFICSAVTITDQIIGLVAYNEAELSYSMNMDKKIMKGKCLIKSTQVPFNNELILKGNFTHVKDPEYPNYPLYKAKLAVTTSSGKSLGIWNVNVDTRMGSVIGKWTYNGKTYKIEFETIDF